MTVVPGCEGSVRCAQNGRRNRPRTLPFVMLAVGAHGLAVQVVVMRTLMAGYAGSELTAVVVLATWLGAEAVGAWIAGRFRTTPGHDALTTAGIAAAILSSLVIPAVMFTRPLFGLLAGEQAGLLAVVGASVLTASVPALLHGILFVEGCRRYSGQAGPSGIGRGYIWEGLGTIAAGVIVAGVLLAGLPGLAIVAGFGALLVLACLYDAGGSRHGPSIGRVTGIVAAVVCAGLVLVGLGARAIESLAWQWAWPGFRTAWIKDSWYGKTVVLTRAGEHTILYDGVAGLPPPDRSGAEQAAVVPLLHAEHGRDVLVLGDGLSAMKPLLRLPVRTVTLVAQDRVFYRARAEALGLPATESEPRLRVVFDDPRRFLRRSRDEYDCIISPGLLPLNLSASRLTTVEYFRLCREQLRPGGVVAVPFPVGGSGIGRLTARLLTGYRMTLETVFDTVLVRALDSPMLIAGGFAAGSRDGRRGMEGGGWKSEDRSPFPLFPFASLPFLSLPSLSFRFPPFPSPSSLPPGDPEMLSGRLAEWQRTRPDDDAMLDSAGLSALLDRFRQEQLWSELAAATGPETRVGPNRDRHPRALVLALARREHETGPVATGFLELLLRAGSRPSTVNRAGLAGVVGMMLLIMLPGFRRGVAARRTLAVASSGFAGSAIVTLGMFAYQTATGALYFGVVLLMSCFMLGTVAGAFTGNRAITGAKPHGHRPGQDRGFLLAEALLVAVPVLMVVVGDRIPGWTQFPLLTLTGWAVGFQFPVAAAIVGGAARPQPGFDIPGAGRTVGRLTAVDLLGGILGLLLLPLVVLPLAGLGWAFALVAAVKLASLAVQAVHDRPGAAAPGAVKL